ncbi:uncharacterized protein LOC116070098 isoform X2 [Mastomys coucha]|nr:uncharacterized protein LOC116070098 isoform X2 [Mastomys coucha]
MWFERTIDKSGILQKGGASVGKYLLRHPGPVFHPQLYETSNQTQNKDMYSKEVTVDAGSGHLREKGPARFRGSYPCRARSPPFSAAPLAQSSPARLPVPRPPLCPPVDAWAERESRAPESSRCKPGTRSWRPDQERARHAAEHPFRIRERGGRRLELRVAGEGDHWVLSLRIDRRGSSSPSSLTLKKLFHHTTKPS